MGFEMKIRSMFCAFAVCIVSMLTGHAIAADKADIAAQANNPLANMKAFNLHNYYIGEQTGSGESANQFWLRYAQPFTLGGDWLMRASLPINHFPTPPDGDKVTGLGDLNAFAAYLFDTGNPAVSFGLGPLISAPTATKDELGSGKWSGGFSNIFFDAKSKKFQYGYLLTWQHSFAGEDDRADVNSGVCMANCYSGGSRQLK